MSENYIINQLENQINNNNGEKSADPFARSGLRRSPTEKEEQKKDQELQEQKQPEQEQRNQQPEQEQSGKQQQPQSQSAWNLIPKQSKVEVAKTVADELREFVNKRHNVHKDIKDLVARIQGSLGSAIKDWKRLTQRAEAAEVELAAIKNTLAAAVLPQVETGAAPDRGAKAKGKHLGTEVTPAFTPKRTRSSPGDVRLAAPKKQRNVEARSTKEARTANEARSANQAISGDTCDTPWREVRNRKDRSRKDGNKTKEPFRRGRKKGEAVIIKTSEDTYADVLRAMRTDPKLKEFGTDVQKIRRTQAGDMIIELNKNSKNRSSALKELTESVLGEKVQVKAMCPEATIQCKDLDEIATEEEVRTALKVQCNLEGVEIKVRLRKAPFGMQAASIKLPIDVANKVMTTGKIKVGLSVCPLRFQPRPEGCYRCLEYGHLARNCKGIDRSKLCRWCGQEGHKAQDCNNEQRCLFCVDKSRNKHAPGGPGCSVYKQARGTKSQWR